MIYKGLALVSLMTVASCDVWQSDGVKLCKSAVELLAKAPSTIRWAKVEEIGARNDATVFIDYDAQNIYGAALRSKALCHVRGAEGEALALIKFSNAGVDTNAEDLRLLNDLLANAHLSNKERAEARVAKSMERLRAAEQQKQAEQALKNGAVKDASAQP